MKILVFADTHSNLPAIKKVLNKVKSADILICCGDLTELGMNIAKTLSYFKKIKIPFLLIHGNHESEDEMKKECKKLKFNFIHKNIFELKNYLFIGYGGGGFSLESKDFEKFIKKIDKKIKNKKIILLTHQPAYGTKVDFINGIGHRGNISIRKFIETHQPLFNLCGHLHETFYKIDKIRKTKILNPGPEGRIINV